MQVHFLGFYLSRPSGLSVGAAYAQDKGASSREIFRD